LTRLSAAGPEVAVVEDQYRPAVRGEPLGERLQAHLAHRSQPVAHDHHRSRLGRTGCGVQPGRAWHAAGEELHIAPLNRRGGRTSIDGLVGSHELDSFRSANPALLNVAQERVATTVSAS